MHGPTAGFDVASWSQYDLQNVASQGLGSCRSSAGDKGGCKRALCAHVCFPQLVSSMRIVRPLPLQAQPEAAARGWVVEIEGRHQAKATWMPALASVRFDEVEAGTHPIFIFISLPNIVASHTRLSPQKSSLQVMHVF